MPENEPGKSTTQKKTNQTKREATSDTRRTTINIHGAHEIAPTQYHDADEHEAIKKFGEKGNDTMIKNCDNFISERQSC